MVNIHYKCLNYTISWITPSGIIAYTYLICTYFHCVVHVSIFIFYRSIIAIIITHVCEYLGKRDADNPKLRVVSSWCNNRIMQFTQIIKLILSYRAWVFHSWKSGTRGAPVPCPYKGRHVVPSWARKVHFFPPSCTACPFSGASWSQTKILWTSSWTILAQWWWDIKYQLFIVNLALFARCDYHVTLIFR